MHETARRLNVFPGTGSREIRRGTALQPACFGYDEAGRMTSLTTFRAGTETISGDPSERTDGDTTTWAYHAATGAELRKTYADGSSTVKTYDAFNRLSTETSARGLVATYAYETARGLLTGISYSDETPGIVYSYNHLGMLVQVTDAAGTRSLGYNAYNEPETDSLVAGEKTHLITELRDSLGRSVGYTYAKDGAVQQTVGTSYGTDGRITGAGFMHGGELKEFTYTYVSGSHLLQGLTMPNNMALALSYESQRDLMTGMVYTRGTTTVVQRGYSYDAIGRPLTRTQSRQGGTRNDSFTHNDRSELTAATLGTDAYAYAYDNIGNRLTAQEAAEETTTYTANNLNQYTAIQEGAAEAFAPTYDADGNQTLVKTSTGIWAVTYNAANRPVVFVNEATGTVVECSYDSSGRRATKKVTVNGTVTLHQRYIYRGYLQIACCDLTRTAHPCLWLITWDPTQPIATRPLAIQKDGTWYTYGFDLTKNVMEVFGSDGYIKTAYTYTPFGEATASGNVTQPIQWSSEYHDVELDLVYYNYRHYNPAEGRWLRRDPMGEAGGANMLCYVRNSPAFRFDMLGGKDDNSSTGSKPPFEYVSLPSYSEKAITLSAEYVLKGGCVDPQAIEQLKDKFTSVIATQLNDCMLNRFQEMFSEPGNPLFNARAREVWTQKIQTPLFSPADQEQQQGELFYLQHDLSYPFIRNTSITSTHKVEYACEGRPKLTFKSNIDIAESVSRSKSLFVGYSLNGISSEMNFTGGRQWTDRKAGNWTATGTFKYHTSPSVSWSASVKLNSRGANQLEAQHSRSDGNSKIEFSGGVERNGKKNSIYGEIRLEFSF